MATIRLQTGDFDVGAEFAALTAGRRDIGGIGCFVGTVRATPGEPQLAALTLEHYPAMTERAIGGDKPAACGPVAGTHRPRRG